MRLHDTVGEDAERRVRATGRATRIGGRRCGNDRSRSTATRSLVDRISRDRSRIRQPDRPPPRAHHPRNRRLGFRVAQTCDDRTARDRLQARNSHRDLWRSPGRAGTSRSCNERQRGRRLNRRALPGGPCSSDAAGIELAGIALPDHRDPTATLTGEIREACRVRAALTLGGRASSGLRQTDQVREKLIRSVGASRELPP